MIKTMEFNIKLTFSNDGMSSFGIVIDESNIIEVAKNIALAIQDKANTSGIAPVRCDEYTKLIEVQPIGLHKGIMLDILHDKVTEWETHPDNIPEPNFNYQDLDEDNKNDLLKWVADDELMGLIDEEKGGIIGYINHKHVNRIAEMLNELPTLKIK